MADRPTLSAADAALLREQHYNATVNSVVDVHSDLRILRIDPDSGMPGFEPGQYTVLGLGHWEEAIDGSEHELARPRDAEKLVRRAYSFSCPMLDDAGDLLPPSETPFAEFYIALVQRSDIHPPSLTPRLFQLSAGDRLFMGDKVTGHYTLEPVAPGDNVVLAATGTGEAPHTGMVAQLLAGGHTGRVAVVTCVRHRRDLAYAKAFGELESRYDGFRYLMLTTREPENVDPSAVGYVGKRYLQDYFDSGDFEREAGFPLEPERTHVFLCGNPSMIGAPHRTRAGDDRYPTPRGMVEVLENRGFRIDERDRPGNLHFEKYW
ncbi:MAG: ferredoxin--NADP reductase [Planctomycetota bacterium]|nr:MAG: ferredoxin--NADP reductase [Planctomycetota bacterium]REJ93056.1 MAG: ferredoxin--NADP reductase [Planctomycetota bacterium]REK30044.1 MAG: ferredoxin--NADP reductase [Planctomycetota bacterium]REK37714.1 MAG: ferredoxin--NADP reductase [Planctomycetota bacterium]